MRSWIRGAAAYAALCLTFVYLASLIPALQVLSGCASVGPEGNAALEVAVKYGVAKLIEESDEVTPERVVAVADALDALVEGNPEITVSELEAGFADVTDLSGLSPADRYAVAALASSIASALRERFPEGGDQVAVAARELLRWAREAAAIAAGPPPSEAGFPLFFGLAFLSNLGPIARRAFSKKGLAALVGTLAAAAATYQAVACSGAGVLDPRHCAVATASTAFLDAVKGAFGSADEPAPEAGEEVAP